MSNKNKKPETGTVELSRCPVCKSTERTPYNGVTDRDVNPALVGESGEFYNRVQWKRTQCKNCGQCRVDRFELYVPEQKDKPKPKPKSKSKSPKQEQKTPEIIGDAS